MPSALAKSQNQTDRSPEASPDLSEIRFPKKIDPVTNSTFTHKDAKYLDDAAFVAAVNKYRPGTPVNPEDFKSFTKLEIDHRVIIFRPGEQMYEYNAAENGFKPLKNINVEKGVKDSITKASNEQFKEEMLKRFPGATTDRLASYDQHNKYFIGKDIAIEDKNTNSIFVLKDKSWQKLEDSQTISLIRKSQDGDRTRLAMGDRPYVEVTLSDSQPARVSVTLDTKTLPIHTHSLSDIAPNVLMASMRASSSLISNLFDSSQTTQVEKVAVDIIKEKYLREEYENPRQSILTQINGLETKREFTEKGSKAYKYVNDDIRCLYDVLEEFEKPLNDKKPLTYEMREYNFNVRETEEAFSQKNLELLENALSTGKINGKEVDKELVKNMLHQHKIFEAIKAGGYDTSEGRMSSYGAMMLSTINYELNTNFPKLGLGKVDTF
jgi:hypothetical protein